jgi:hypothetical protein
MLYDHVVSLSLPTDWLARVSDCQHELQMLKICRQNEADGEPFVVARTLTISESFMWSSHIHGHKLNPHFCSVMSKMPDVLNYDDFKELVTIIVKCNVCCGHPDQMFVEMARAKKGIFFSIGKEVIAALDSRFSVVSNGVVSTCTVRHVNCELLIAGVGRCKVCSEYRGNLRAMYSNFSRQKSWSAKVNTRYL